MYFCISVFLYFCISEVLDILEEEVMSVVANQVGAQEGEAAQSSAEIQKYIR